MAHLYFHCTNSDDVLVDHTGTEMLDLADARDHALTLARSIVAAAYGIHDFSDWCVYVGDEENEEVLTIPFTSALPTVH